MKLLFKQMHTRKGFFEYENEKRLNNETNHGKLMKWKVVDCTELGAFLDLLIQASVKFNNHQSLEESFTIS